MLTLSSLARSAKHYALTSSISNEEFLNALLEPFVQAGRVKNKMGSEFRFDKVRTSKVLAGKIDVPQSLKRALARVGIEHNTAQRFDAFLEEYFNMDYYEDFCESISNLLDDEESNTQLKTELLKLKNNPPAYFAHCLICAIKNNNLSTSSKILWEEGAGSFALETGDLLDKGFGRTKKQKDIVVVPVNTGFDTEISWIYEGLTNPLVSAGSLHGQWLSRMYKSGETPDSLRSRIFTDLIQHGHTAEANNNHVTHEREFPIGTIATIENNKAVFLLLAIANFDKRNNAQSNSDMIEIALDKLFEHYDFYGQGLDLYLPLLGTGLSRARLTHKESFHLISESINKNRNHILGKVTLMVHPDDVNKLKEIGTDQHVL